MKMVAVKLTLVARDPESIPDNSPTLYRNEDGDWIVQGFVVDDSAALSQMTIPAGETCVRIPHRMIQFFTEE
jgi:hypothetical protein